MPATKTRNDLINKAYSILAATNTPPEAEDVAAIDANIDPLIEQLSVDNIVAIDPAEIPVEYFLPLARLLVNVCGPGYGSPMNEEARLIDEAMLRRLTASRPTYETTQADYF